MWEDESRHHYCQDCIDKLSKIESKAPTVIRKIMMDNGKTINKGHLEHIHSRVINDEGKTLSGSEGLNYMKSKGDKYAGRLKGYYEPKP